VKISQQPAGASKANSLEQTTSTIDEERSICERPSSSVVPGILQPMRVTLQEWDITKLVKFPKQVGEEVSHSYGLLRPAVD